MKPLTYPPNSALPDDLTGPCRVEHDEKRRRTTPGGAEWAIVTPTAKTSTPSHGAHQPSTASELENARSGGTPTAPIPATMPKASRPSCVPPQTRRLEPAIIWPSVSSRKAVVSATPGMKTTSEAIIARRPGSVTSYSTASAVSAATQKAARNGMSVSIVRRPRPSRRRTPTSAPSMPAARTSRAGGMEDERDPDRERGVPEQARHGSEAVAHRADLLEPRDPCRRRDQRLLGLLGEHVDGRDLIEPGRRGEPASWARSSRPGRAPG